MRRNVDFNPRMIHTRDDLPPKDLLKKLENISPNDIGHFIDFGHADSEIQFQYTSETVNMVGTALTVRVPPEDGTMIHKSIDMIREGDVVVIDAQGHTSNAVWGDTTSLAAQFRGAKGVVIDGSITDMAGMREIGLPAYSRGRSTRTARLRGTGGEINTTVQIGGAVVQPGDIVLGNEDGVLFIPQDKIEFVIATMEERKKDYDLLEELEKGRDLAEISGADKYIEN